MAILTPPVENVIGISSHYRILKRLLDIVVTILLLPLLIVLCLGVALMIRFDSQGPVLFKQKRVGMNGVEFDFYKFRSMYMDSDDSVHRNAIKQYMNGEILNGHTSTATMYKLVNDPRVTRVGHFIRKTSLDELPQFFNILRGDMSLVGPRPPLPYEVESYSERNLLRLCGKPGLTGFWQVYGRSRVPFAEMVEMDIAYLQRQSILIDIKLILLTVPVMLFGRGGA